MMRENDKMQRQTGLETQTLAIVSAKIDNFFFLQIQRLEVDLK